MYILGKPASSHWEYVDHQMVGGEMGTFWFKEVFHTEGHITHYEHYAELIVIVFMGCITMGRLKPFENIKKIVAYFGCESILTAFTCNNSTNKKRYQRYLYRVLFNDTCNPRLLFQWKGPSLLLLPLVLLLLLIGWD